MVERTRPEQVSNNRPLSLKHWLVRFLASDWKGGVNYLVLQGSEDKL